MRTLIILIAITLTACAELPTLPDNPFENDPPTPPVATSTAPPRDPLPAGDIEDAPAACNGITVDRVYGCKLACDQGQQCAGGDGMACMTECIAGVAAGSWCPFPAAR